MQTHGTGWIMGAVILVVLIGTIALMVTLIHGSRKEPRSVYRPVGYYERVTELVKGGGLKFIPPYETSEQQVEDGNTWGRIVFNPRKAKPHQQKFYQESGRLRRDIDQFNHDGSGGLFHVGGNGRISLNKWTHNFALPYPERASFKGTFSFRGDELPTLAGESLMLAFVENRGEVRTHAKERVIVPARVWFGSDKNRAYRAKGYDLQGLVQTGALIRFDVEGEDIRMECVEGRHDAMIMLNGVALNRGEREELADIRDRAPDLDSNVYLLKSGDRLRVVSKDRETIFRFGKFAGGVISRSWLEGGKKISRIDPELVKEIPYLGQLHNAAQRYVRYHPRPDSVGNPNLQITLDRQLHRSVREELYDFVQDFDKRLSAIPEIERKPAAVAMIDALTGDVIAMPSYPSPEQLEKLEELANTGRIAKMRTSEKIRLSRNQNLKPIVIGSTIKPMLASAIWQNQPELMRLVVNEPANGQLSRVHGYKLSKPIGSIGPRVIDAEQFLTKSSNAYTVALYFATLAGPDSYRMSREGKLVPGRGYKSVDFSRFFRGDAIPGGLDREGLDAHKVLLDLYDIKGRYDHAAGQGGVFDSSLLEPMLRELGVSDGQVPEAFFPVSSMNTNLQLARIDTVRGELVSFLVGGFTNQWSNVKLAEAYARIGTGKRVRMRLVKAPWDTDTPPKDLPVSNEVRQLIHKGMYGAVKTGTAARLNATVRAVNRQLAGQGLELYVVGKTGTARRAKNRECAALCLYMELRGKKEGEVLSAVSTAIYLEDRATTRSGSGIKNSSVAVEFSKTILPHALEWMKARPKTREYLTR